MLDFIDTLIRATGPRPPGSQAEAAGQALIAERFAAFSSVVVEPFEAALTAKFQSLKLFCFVYYVCLGLFWVSVPLATIVATINVILFLGHFVTYRDWLDPLFPKQLSSNVIGTLEPQGEVRSTLLVAGHVDSVYEFQWWYRLKQTGAVFSVLSGFLFLFLPIFYAIIVVTGTIEATAATIVWIIFLLTAPITLSYFFMHGTVPVDGAIDNLSGVAVAWGVGKHFATDENGRSSLKHTRLRIISFGAEEAGLKGSQAYLDAHSAENELLLNVESIRSVEQLKIATGELNVLVKYPQAIVERMQRSFVACGVPPNSAWIGIGASDGASFGMRGRDAICLVGIDMDRLDETYHTRLDTTKYIDPAGMEITKDILVHFIESWDAEDR